MTSQPPAAQFKQAGAPGWTDPDAAEFVGRLQALGSHALVANVEAQALVEQAGGHPLPVIVTDGAIGMSYIAAPHSVYALYPRAELDLVDLGWMRMPAAAAIAAADRLLRTLDINRAVQIDNWLLSTCLHGNWKGEGLAELRQRLAARFPGHYLLIRSVDDWSCPELTAALRGDGWLLLPCRQIWVTDDLQRDWAVRKSVKNDGRKLAQSGLVAEDVTHLDDADAARVAALYAMLYIAKYSALNPQYSAAWMQLAVESGLFHLRVVRDRAGQIMAAVGIVARGGIATNPMMGYDTQRPQSDGLYRIASWLVGDFALRQGLRLHGSAGAGHFKQQRGARSEIDYMAIHAAHLPATRRWPLKGIAAALETLAVPQLKQRML
ncbi:hypothetical protein [Sphingomonas ursincola]|uniref:hypothetical protein n=1 Tax=Sphingomonas ursincola TaxID=56361 RepID=UPI00235784D0|nr:hypothetical protein [Sphingomonas ursincola]MBY0620692.1 hypothetical protein [Sphingomonas ursincola]